MKKIYCLVLVCCFSTTLLGQAILKGGITEAGSAKILLYKYVNDFYASNTLNEYEEIALDYRGRFEKKLAVASPRMVLVMIGALALEIFVEPGAVVELDIDGAKFNQTEIVHAIRFGGSNAAGNQLFFTTNYQPGKKIKHYQSLVDSIGFHKNFDLALLDIVLNKMLQPFDSLRNTGQVTTGFYAIVAESLRQLFISREANYLFVGNRAIGTEKALQVMGLIYDRYPVSPAVMKYTDFGSSVMFYYYWYKAALHYQTPRYGDSTLYLKGTPYFVNKNILNWLFAPDSIRETAWVLELVSVKKLFADSYGQRDIDAYKAFYPNSAMSKYLLPPYFAPVEPAKGKADSTLIRILTLKQSDKMQDIIGQYYKDKLVYVDFWASWCAPCKQEFAYNAQLDSFFAKHNIERLYISLDQVSIRGSFLKNIYAYNLKGNHVLVNEQFFNDIKERFSKDGQFPIPRYMFFGKDGALIADDAPRPSATDFFVQIKKLMATKNQL